MHVRHRAALAAACLSLSAGAAAAEESACGRNYAIQRGDTLQLVVNRVYGPEHSWKILHEANRATIGRNASLIEVGMVIFIPCLDDAGAPIAAPEETAEAAAAPESPAPDSLAPDSLAPGTLAPGTLAPGAAAPAAPAAEAAVAGVDGSLAPPAGPPPRPRLLVVTASGWPPYHDRADPAGGMLVEMLDAALARVAAPGEWRIDFIEDRAAQLRPLIEDQLYDLSFSWARPDCGAAEDEAAGRCGRLAWSDPIFELVLGVWVRAGEPAPASLTALAGRTLCRPAGRPLALPEAAGLRLLRPATAEACVEALLAGEADAVALAAPVAEAAIARLDADQRVVEAPELAAAATLHAVVSVDHPRRDELLGLVNEGLRRIREDGAWFAIVQRHLLAHGERTAAGG